MSASRPDLPPQMSSDVVAQVAMKPAWTTPSPVTAKTLLANPLFERVAASSMQGSIDLHQGGGLSNWILNDRARAVFGYSLLYLHATRRPDDPRSGLTAARVKELSVETGLCSAGRAAAILALMRIAGYVAPAPSAEDRRVRRLAPTEKLLSVQRARLCRQFEALAIILPQARNIPPLFACPDFEHAFARAIGEQFVGGFRILSAAPDLTPFAERSAGMVVLFSLMLATESGGSFVMDQPVAISIAELSRRLRVSRTQILRLLREAEAHALLARAGASYDTIVLRPKLKQDLLNMLAAMFALLNDAAAQAMSAQAKTMQAMSVQATSGPAPA